jgi:O-antigen biosynthesis protein
MLRVCFITRQLDGLENNGGIGTATRYISEHLAGAGYNIDVFHTGAPCAEFGALKDHLAGQGINLFGIHEDAAVFHYPERRPYQIYSVLKQTHYEVYIFHEWQADGFFCFLAKKTGTAFKHAKLGVVLHSSSEWCHEGNKVLFPEVDDYQVWEMEQACCELADFAVSPSQYLLDWCREAGWKLPDDSRVIPNLVHPPGYAGNGGVAAKSDPYHFAFFGRLEERKGIQVFMDALKLLPPAVLGKMQVSLLGSESGFTTEQIRGELSNEIDRLRGFNIETCFGSLAAREYLQEQGCIAVMPSHIDNSPCVIYECLEMGLPFIISNQGGGKELVAAEDQERCTFAPNKKALAARMEAIVSSGAMFEAARPAYTVDGVVAGWGALLESMVEVENRSFKEPENPLVSVVLVHHERPGLLDLALGALLEQDYSNYEILIVDDGSSSKAARRYLERVEELQKGPVPVRVLRQDNRYLGAARNHGVREARGDYVLFFDDDNIAFPSLISTHVAALQFSGADVTTSAMRALPYKEGGPQPKDEQNPIFTFWGGCTGLSGMLINHFGDAVGLYRKTVLEQVGGFHERYGVTFEDWQLHVKIQTAGFKILSIPEPLYWYRTSVDGMLQSTNQYDNIQRIAEVYAAQMPERFRKLPGWLIGHAKRALLDRHQLRDDHALSVLSAVSALGVEFSFFGAGKHTIRLLERMVDRNVALPRVIYDDNPQCAELFGVSVKAPENELLAGDAIVLSTDTYMPQMKARCEEIWGAEVKSINLYAGFSY